MASRAVFALLQLTASAQLAAAQMSMVPSRLAPMAASIIVNCTLGPRLAEDHFSFGMGMPFARCVDNQNGASYHLVDMMQLMAYNLGDSLLLELNQVDCPAFSEQALLASRLPCANEHGFEASAHSGWMRTHAGARAPRLADVPDVPAARSAEEVARALVTSLLTSPSFEPLCG